MAMCSMLCESARDGSIMQQKLATLLGKCSPCVAFSLRRQLSTIASHCSWEEVGKGHVMHHMTMISSPERHQKPPKIICGFVETGVNIACHTSAADDQHNITLSAML